ncbi:TetR/AcrR family transcriptional regulator [Yinghuangia sp. ASG 101]|uniref:TetR/AcrR family transcriptional regulator n=1 Tax=Yinghuangia sp. ASG 101 TaxID=2896848 RepID=UPI001E469724|nr:TetR/AcrR family transcriptional regulator [Yinghuangia sp. ASG 101]UGQ11771.1 TetR/AcrR family transcriptional regulator [Yinghuangia sp. ASG 101]
MAPKDTAGSARERMRSAALSLFSLHGVNGTSLQMIADEIGVTKAAVYYHFPTKEDLVHAVITPYSAQLASLVEAAEGHRRRADRTEAILAGLVGLVVGNRHLNSALLADPVIVRVLHARSDMRDLDRRITALLVGPAPDSLALTAAVMVSSALTLAPVDPRLTDLDDATLRHNLLTTARHLLKLRAPASRTARPARTA